MKGTGDGNGRADDASSTEDLMTMYLRLLPLAALALVESFSIGILVPLTPFVVTEYFARHYTHGVPIDCGKHPHTAACIAGSKDADWWTSWIGAVGSICFFMASPTVGITSDIYGRKPFVVVSQFMRVGLPFAMLYFTEYGGLIWPYFVLRLITIVFDITAVTSAAVADLISAEHRGTGYGFLFAVFSIGLTSSAGVAGLVTRGQVMRISAVLCVLKTVLSILFYPETLPPEKRTKKTNRHRRCENPIAGMSILLRSQLVTRLTAMIALTTFIGAGTDQIQMFFLNTVIGFNEKDTAKLMVTFGIGSIVAQLLLFQPLMRCGKEKGVILIAIVSNMVECGAYVLSAFIPEKWVIYSTILPSSLEDLSFAAISSLTSINCSDREQGRLQGAIYSISAVCQAAGPVVFAFLYNQMNKHIAWTRALPYAVALVLYGCSAILAMLLPTASAKSESSTTSTSTASAGESFTYDDECLSEPLLAQFDDDDGEGSAV